MSVHLTSLFGTPVDLRLSAYEFPVTIGRHDGASIFLGDQWVSRWHCKLIADDDGQLKVVDLGSRHGTFVNGERVDEATLEHGDELNIGLTTLRVTGSLYSEAPSNGHFQWSGV